MIIMMIINKQGGPHGRRRLPPRDGLSYEEFSSNDNDNNNNDNDSDNDNNGSNNNDNDNSNSS